MDAKLMQRLQFSVQDKFFRIIMENTHEVNDETRKRSQERWKTYCDSIGFVSLIEGVHPREGWVAIRDPSPWGVRLEMIKETALKILSMGLP